MSDKEEIGLIETNAFLALEATLTAIGKTPDQKMRLAMLYVYDLCRNEAWGISTREFMNRASATLAVLEKRDKRDADFKARMADLADKGFHGHPQKRDLKAAE